jgi:hypothetical protein
LFYWRSTSVAELDFLVEVQGQVIPLEIKAGVNPKSKSLQSFDRRFNPPLLGRCTLLNLRHDNQGQ